MGKEEVYDISFVEGKLHILRKNFDMRTEIEHRFVSSNPTCTGRLAHRSSADLTMGIPHHRLRDSGSNITSSYCFEELCTRSMTQKRHGTFFSVVRRNIGGLGIIMAGEVDCSASTCFR